MTDITILFWAAFILVGVLATLGMAGVIAWLCGCDVNEPEYYEYKQRKQDNDS
jgi:hypothetical protein